jgi:hypothetical protein
VFRFYRLSLCLLRLHEVAMFHESPEARLIENSAHAPNGTGACLVKKHGPVRAPPNFRDPRLIRFEALRLQFLGSHFTRLRA